MNDTDKFEFKCLDLICEQNKSLNLLLSNILLHKTTNNNYSVYDNCFGIGGIFDSIAEYNNNDSRVLYYGQEINIKLFDYYKSKISGDNYILQNTNSITNNSFSDIRFDYLINNPPMNYKLPKDDIKNYLERNQNVIENVSRGEYIFLIDLINKSKDDSRIVSLVPSNFLYSTTKEISSLRRYLIENDMLESVIRCPEGALPDSSIPFYILVIDRNKNQILSNKIQLFNAASYFKKDEQTNNEENIYKELNLMRKKNHHLYFHDHRYRIKKRFDISKISLFLDDYLSFENSKHKMIIDIDENLDFLRFESLFMIRDIKENMKSGELLSFGNILEEVRMIDLSPLKKIKKNHDIEEFLEKYKDIQDSNKNYVFFPTMPGPNTRVRNGSLLDLEKYRYLSVKLKDDIDSNYVTDLYNTKTGKDFIKTVTRGQFMPNLTINCIKDMPYIENKDFDITKKNDEFAELIEKLSKYIDESFDDPNTDIYTIINNVLPGYDIKSLINGGEGNKVEFKSTFSKPLETSSKNVSNKELRFSLETACLKTISGFLNADGGKLLIGVMDNGEIIGIESDLHKNKDEHNLDLSQKIEARIGLAYVKYTDIVYHSINGKTVCEVTCKSLREINADIDIAPLKDKKSSAQSSWKYYVRSQAKTISLEGKDLLDYLKDNS